MKFIVITLAIFSSVFAKAQEAPDPIRAEYFTCSLNEGKDMDDMMKWVENGIGGWMQLMKQTTQLLCFFQGTDLQQLNST